MGEISARLERLGIAIPDAAAPLANYVGWVRSGDLVFVSGQVTLKDGKPHYIGKLGAGIGLEAGQAAARLCAINIVAQLKQAAGGDLDRVQRILRLGGFVNSTPDFVQQPQVIDSASDLMVEVFGEKGHHSRAAVSVSSLPLGVAVEIDCIAEVSGG
ncbi:MAG: RidA family protein [Rhodospirillales bacterium]|nr:RidA family protein [Rhodospirillales bacterium]